MLTRTHGRAGCVPRCVQAGPPIAWLYLEEVRLLSINPWGGPAAGGTQLVLVGDRLLGALHETVCRFAIGGVGMIDAPASLIGGGERGGGAAMSEAPLEGVVVYHHGRASHVVSRLAGRTATCTSPSIPHGALGGGGLGAGSLSVSVDGGQRFSNSLDYLVYSASLSSVRPSGGPEAGGTRVTVFGSALVRVSEASSCAFGSSFAPATIVDSTSALCISPTREEPRTLLQTMPYHTTLHHTTLYYATLCSASEGRAPRPFASPRSQPTPKTGQ